MKRAMLVTAMVAGIVPQTAHPQNRPPAKPRTLDSLPAFSFLGDSPETPTARTSLNGTDCVSQDDKLQCADYSSPVIAGVALNWLTLSYNKRKLYRVMGSLDNRRYPVVLEAFKVKYGKPSISTRKWQSRAGATFDNEVATWVFRDGALTLESIGQAVNESFFAFVSATNAPPAPAPKVDF